MGALWSRDGEDTDQDEVDGLVARWKMRAGDDDEEEEWEDDGEGEEDIKMKLAKKRKPFVDTTYFNIVIGIVVGLNAVTIGLEVDAKTKGEGENPIWFFIEVTFCVIFFSELCARFWYHRLFFFFLPGQKWWNRLDFAIVALQIVDTFMLTPLGFGGNIRFVTMLRFARLARLVRLIRLFRFFKELWLVASGLIESMKTLLWVCIILFMLCYVFAIFMTVTIGQNDELYDPYFRVGPCGSICEDDPIVECTRCKVAYAGKEPFDHERYFRTVMVSVFTLLQVLTLDGWTEEIARHVVHQQGWQIIFFVLFIALGSFGLLNIIIGVVVENTLSTSEKDANFVQRRKERDRQNVLAQLKEIFLHADANANGTLSIEEVKSALDKPEVFTNLQKIEFPVENPEEIFDLLDYDDAKELTIDEFIIGCMRVKGEAKSKDLLDAQVALRTMARHYDILKAQMTDFNKKLRLLEQTAESLIDHGECVFLNAQEFRMRHPQVKESQPLQIQDHVLDAAPWERWQGDDFPAMSWKEQNKAMPTGETASMLQFAMLTNEPDDRRAQLMDVEPPPLPVLMNRPHGDTVQSEITNIRAIQDIPGAIQDIGPEAGAVVLRRT